MYLSKRSNGVYYLWYTDDLSKKHKVSTGSRLKSEALKFLQRFRLAENDVARRSRKKLLSEFIKEFLPYAEANYSRGTVGIYKSTLTRFQVIAGDCHLISLTAQDIDRYRTKRLETISAVTVNIELRTLRAAFNVARRWKLVEGNPLEGIKLTLVPERMPIFFTKGDFQKLISVIAETWLREIIVFAVLTGMRRGEITNLKWNEVDLPRKLIHIQSTPTFRTKQGKRRTIPINDVAFHLLDGKHAKSVDEHVFTISGNKISDSWLSHKFKYYIHRAKLSNDRLHFHSLRHTFASWLVQDGVSLYEVQKLLGHSNIGVTQVYSHLLPERLHSAVNRISIQLK
ncbi:MAG TPA: tyrosine-type recombinase/integrase [Bacteroidota bacterium]|nr:tyrosine-type recombinase/integrase [Bacteroidota bacterium]